MRSPRRPMTLLNCRFWDQRKIGKVANFQQAGAQLLSARPLSLDPLPEILQGISVVISKEKSNASATVNGKRGGNAYSCSILSPRSKCSRNHSGSSPDAILASARMQQYWKNSHAG